MQKYFLGVDGGNTKTDYLLCESDGTVVKKLRAGTCSHEHLGFDGMEREMRAHLSELFSCEKINLNEIAAAGFGLAGADFSTQIEELKKRVEAIGFSRYALGNDGILGIKAASENGAGICAVNGTGTVVVGINKRGEFLQIGGVGGLGNNAGGSHLREKIIHALYDFHFRCGENSKMFSSLSELLDANEKNLLEKICDYTLHEKYFTEIIQIGAKAAAENDCVAKKIFDDAAISIAKSAAGCIKKLSFDEPVDIVLVGSIWHKTPYAGMSEIFLHTTQNLCEKICRIVKLETTAAVGGVFWAKEIFDGAAPGKDFRASVMKKIV
ncbi:MAG: hypothetical protein FWD19_02995 [Defluviitaleaceae bacterium]|nr:hypothetical protein [Defluviitaleaceae bacterium]